MKQVKNRGTVVLIFFIQRLNSCRRLLNELFITGFMFLCRIAKICEQGEINIWIAIRQIANFERFEELFNSPRTRQHRGHDDQRGMRGGNAFGKIQAWKLRGFDKNGCQPVHERHSQLTGTDQGQQRQRPQCPSGNPRGGSPTQEWKGGDHHYGQNASEIKRERMSFRQTGETKPQGKSHVRSPFQNSHAFSGQIKTNVCWKIISPTGIFAGQINGTIRHFQLGKLAMAGDAFHGVPVKIARGKIHFGINSCRIGAQHLLDHALVFDKLLPVHRIQETEAADAVADGHLRGCLMLAFALHQLCNRQALRRQPFLDPVRHQFHRRRFRLHPL